MQKQHEQFEQQAKDVLLEISESQPSYDTWNHNLLAMGLRDKSFNEFAASKPKSKPSRKRIDTQGVYTYRQYRTPRQLSSRPQLLKVNNLMCYDTLKVLDECRPVLSHRANRPPKAPSRSISKRGSTYASNALPVMGELQEQEAKMKYLEESLAGKKSEWLKPPDNRVGMYRKYSKYNMSGVRHQHWGDYVIHLPSVLKEIKTNCIR